MEVRYYLLPWQGGGRRGGKGQRKGTTGTDSVPAGDARYTQGTEQRRISSFVEQIVSMEVPERISTYMMWMRGWTTAAAAAAAAAQHSCRCSCSCSCSDADGRRQGQGPGSQKRRGDQARGAGVSSLTGLYLDPRPKYHESITAREDRGGVGEELLRTGGREKEG